MKFSGNHISDYSAKTGYWLSLFTLFWLLTAILRFISYLAGYRAKASAELKDGKWIFSHKVTLFGIAVKDLIWSVDEGNVISRQSGVNGDSSILLQGIILMIYCAFFGILAIFRGMGASETGIIFRGVVLLVSGLVLDASFATIYIFHTKKFGKSEIFEFSNGKTFAINPEN
ncbi:hypothetical protein KKF34_06530 [Myxococcota bacterium]|nr:hypothetical protein [Myxococcota bacterium]MBU1381672.1 hypothetical protein [Myxococcota bacterium]MBU1496515.1 hypothetical protein [Myxococcota bacterium]